MKNYDNGLYQQAQTSMGDLEPEEDGINIKKWIVKILINWYLFAIGVMIALGFAYFVNKKQVSSFKVASTVLIEEVKNSSNIGAQQLMTGYGLAGYTNVNNQVVILQSYAIIEKAVRTLDLSVDYYQKKRCVWFPFIKMHHTK